MEHLLADTDCVAVTLHQPLAPMEGWALPVFPPTYPAPDKQSGHRHDTPYTINVLNDGTKVASLDSVQSQANRMEAAFHDGLADYVPRVEVTAGQRTLPLTALPHRVADASIRSSDMGDAIRAAFEAYDRGDPLPIAQLGPTSLVYGAWDSRDTRVKIPRLIRSEIYATDVDVYTRSAQFSGAFDREELGFTEKEWKEGAELGFAPTPSVNDHGGVLVHGGINHTASLHLASLRKLDRACQGLGTYALGLALGGLWYGARDYDLRTGCWLVPEGAPTVEQIRRDGTRDPASLTQETVDQALSAAERAAQEIGIPIGEQRQATYDPKAGKSLLKSAKEG